MNLKLWEINRDKNGNYLRKHHFFQKRTIIKTLMLCLPILIIFSGSSFANSDGLAEKGADRFKSEHTFEIGPVFNYFEYKEPDIDVDLTGYMAGATGKYKYCSARGFFFSAELEYNYGLDIEYDGGTFGGTPLKEDSKDWIAEARLLTGGMLKLNKHFIINPYIGFGYRYWHNDIEGTGSYKRKTEYMYLPVGTNVFYKVSENFKWGVCLEFDIFLKGQNKSDLSDADPGFNDVTLGSVQSFV